MSFQQGLSGLSAASRTLDVIGNNIANSGTVGAKASRVEFADAFANAIGGSAGAVALGVTIASVSQQFTQGDISSTSNPMDLAIDGKGFFQVSTGGAMSYTRNGQFRLDSQGYLVTAQGGRVQGKVVDPVTGNLSQVTGDIKTSTTTMAPKVTGQIGVGTNLDARATVPTVAFSPTDAATYNNVVSSSVYSPQGQAHTLGLFYRKTSDNTWDVYGTFDGTALAGNPVQTMAFDPASGRLTTTPATSTITLPFPAAEGGDATATFDFSKTTQFGSPFIVNELSQNGYGPGELAGFGVDAEGKVLARYTNGRTEVQASVLLTNFRNPQGLQAIGGNQWVETGSSGSPNQLQSPGTGILGSLRPSALEQSNVELTGELVNMITAQRVYQANAQTIRAQDQLLQTIVNLR
jgi:flagellar hook protein FlgE